MTWLHVAWWVLVVGAAQSVVVRIADPEEFPPERTPARRVALVVASAAVLALVIALRPH